MVVQFVMATRFQKGHANTACGVQQHTELSDGSFQSVSPTAALTHNMSLIRACRYLLFYFKGKLHLTHT